MLDVYEEFQKLYKLYDTKLELSGVLIITIILAGCIIAIWIDDKQNKHSIPDYIRDGIIVSIIAQMFGLYVYSKKKTSHNPEAVDTPCPKCKIQMSLTVTKSWKCLHCGGSFPN